MKLLFHIIVNFILQFLIGLFLWFKAKINYDNGLIGDPFYNPHLFSGFLGVVLTPVLLGIVLPSIVSLIALFFGRTAFKTTFIILMYIMLIYSSIGFLGNLD